MIIGKNNAKNTLKIKKNKQLHLQTVVSLDLQSRFCIAGKLVICLLLGIGYSIVTPSLLHRYSIETMDLIWSNDGVAMKYLWRKRGLTGVEQFSQKIGKNAYFAEFSPMMFGECKIICTFATEK